MFLKEGMIFKNYKELCGFMGWETTRGNYMKARLKELDSLCKWYRQGNKMVIEIVYELRKPKEDGRFKNSTYLNPVEAILLFALKEKENPEVYFSNSKMYKLLGMFNSKFEELNYGDTNAMVEELLVDYLTAKSFKINSKAEANRIIKRALNSMKDRRVIDYTNSKIIVSYEGKHRVATSEESKILLKLEKEVLDELNCYSYSQMEFKNLTYKYYNLLKKKIESSELKDFQYSYEGFCVISHNKIVSDEIDRQCKDVNFKMLNGLFVDKMKSVAISRHNKALKKLGNDTKFGSGIAIGEASDTFIDQYGKMINTYVKVK